MIFKASGIYDIYKDTKEPEYFTVLAQEKPRGKRMYCADSNGEVLKLTTLKEAKEKAKEMKADFDKAN